MCIKHGILEFYENEQSLAHYTTINNLVGIGYLDTPAGSNPREFQGMSKTNTNILKSFLDDRTFFWSKHLGINLTIKKGEIRRNSRLTGNILYEDACITNGLQTISIFRILLMIKIYQLNRNRSTIHKRIVSGNEDGFRNVISNEIGDISEDFFSSISIKQINCIYNWFYKKENEHYLDIINKMSKDNILQTVITVKSIMLDNMVTTINSDSEYILQKLGDTIALSNNETQNVREDDKFGTKRRKWLDDNFLCNVSGQIVDVEYRKFSTKKGDLPTKHILDILRSIIFTSLIVDTREKTSDASMVSKYANSRVILYSLFEKFISRYESNPSDVKMNQVITIIKNMMPSLLNLMFVFEEKLNEYYSTLDIKKICKYCDISEDEFFKKISLKDDEDRIVIMEKINENIGRTLKFSSLHLFPIFIFSVRKAIIVNEKLNVNIEIDEKQIEKVIDLIYYKMLNLKFNGQIGSLSDLYRKKELYSDMSHTCSTIISGKINYMEVYRVNLC